MQACVQMFACAYRTYITVRAWAGCFVGFLVGWSVGWFQAELIDASDGRLLGWRARVSVHCG